MSRSLTKNYTDSSQYTLSTSWKGIDWGSDFRIKSENSNELILTNLTSPIDRPETVRVGHQPISNIYKNTGIDGNYYAPTTGGIKLLTALYETWQYADAADSAANPWYLPVSGTLTLSVPNIDAITADDVLAFAIRLIATLMETPSADAAANSERFRSLLRGSLRPSDL